MPHLHNVRLIPVHIAALRLGQPSRTIRRHILMGWIPAVRVNRRAWGIPEDVIERLRKEVSYGRA
jgi:hypothetical protein